MSKSVYLYPERISTQGSHHGQKQGLLQQREHSADQRLHARQTAELGGWVSGEEAVENQFCLFGSAIAYGTQKKDGCVRLTRQHRGHRPQSG